MLLFLTLFFALGAVLTILFFIGACSVKTIQPPPLDPEFDEIDYSTFKLPKVS